MDNFRDSYFQVDWDLTAKRLRGTYWGKQYDTGRGFAVTVINGGQVVAPTTEVLRLKWEKPDKTTGYVNATIVDGKFIIENIDQMFTVHGSVRADFELSVGGEFVASITFYVNVEKAVAVDAIESSSDFTALQDAVGSVDSLQQQFNNVVANVTVDSEVIAARGTEPTLGARLDSTDAQLDQHKLDYATLKGVNSGALTSDKTDFIFTKNKFQGEVLPQILVGSTEYEIIETSLPNTYSAIVPIEDGKTYTVTKYQGGNRFRLAAIAEYPYNDLLPMGSLYSYDHGNTSNKISHTFTNTHNAKYLVITTNYNSTNQIPNIQVEEGTVETAYEFQVHKFKNLALKSIESKHLANDVNRLQYKHINTNKDVNRTTIINRGKNLFNGNFMDNFTTLSFTDITNAKVVTTTDPNRYSAIVEIEPNETYTITKLLGGNRFNIAVLPEYPDVNNTPMKILYMYRGLDSNTLQSHTFTNTMDGKYLFLQTNVNRTSIPNVQVEKGNSFTGFEKYGEGFLQDMNNVVKISNKNLFTGEYEKEYGILRNTEDNSFRIAPRANGRVFISPIEPDETYTISFPKGESHNLATVIICNSLSEQSFADRLIWDSLEEGVFENTTFTNTSEGKVLYIYVSNEGEEPKMQIEKGSSATSYEPYRYIENKYINIPFIENSQINQPKKYYFSDDLVGIYETDLIVNVDNPVSATHEVVYDRYDTLQVENSEYITKELLGNVTDDKPVYLYHLKPHSLGASKPMKTPKIIVTSGLHGNEKNTVYALLNFIEKMCREWQDNKILEFFRFNVEFLIVPVANPSGFDANTRANTNEVDLNRNFPDRWEKAPTGTRGSEPASEPETKLLINLVKEHQDAEIILDYHRMFFRDGYMAYTITDNDEVIQITNKVIAQMGRKWQREYSFFPQDINHEFGYNTGPLPGSFVYHAETSLGVRGFVLELVEQIEWQPEWSKYDDLTILTGTELLTNTLKGLMKIL